MIQDGRSLYHVDWREKYEISVTNSLFRLNLESNAVLKFDPLPANVMVAVFTEDRLVSHSQPNQGNEIPIYEGSEILVLAHMQHDPQLDQIQSDLDNSKMLKSEFIQLARSHATPNWSLIECTVRKQRDVRSMIQLRVCGVGNPFRQDLGKIIGVVGFAILFLGFFFFILTFVLYHATPSVTPSPMSTDGFYGHIQLENGTSIPFIMRSSGMTFGQFRRFLLNCLERLNLTGSVGTLSCATVFADEQTAFHLCDQ